MELKIGNNPELIKQAQAIRRRVFSLEQQIPQQLDLDGLDPHSFHALVTEHGHAIATARLTLKEDGCSVLARVAVDKAYRGLGIAAEVVRALMAHAAASGAVSIELHAHSYLKAYYENFGFYYVKEAEIVGGHPLIEMNYQIVR